MHSPIPLVSPPRQNHFLLKAYQKKLSQVLSTGGDPSGLGKEVEWFEKSLPHSLGYNYCVGCSSGTDALVLSLKATNLPTGTEVLIPAYSPIAAANAIVWAGYCPVFADVSPENACLSIETVWDALTPKTRAVMAIDSFGHQAPIKELSALCRKQGLYLIENAAQALGVPNRGAHFLTLSFNPLKSLGAMGHAGAILTDSADLANRLRELKNHGGVFKNHHVRIGTNATMDPFQAALLNLKIPKIQNWISIRRSLSSWYCHHLRPWEFRKALILPQDPLEPCDHVWSRFALRILVDREKLMDELHQQGVQCDTGLPTIPPFRQPSFSEFQGTQFPITERLCKEVLCLPLFPELTGKEVHFVIQTLSQCLENLFKP